MRALAQDTPIPPTRVDKSRPPQRKQQKKKARVSASLPAKTQLWKCVSCQSDAPRREPRQTKRSAAVDGWPSSYGLWWGGASGGVAGGGDVPLSICSLICISVSWTASRQWSVEILGVIESRTLRWAAVVGFRGTGRVVVFHKTTQIHSSVLVLKPRRICGRSGLPEHQVNRPD